MIYHFRPKIYCKLLYFLSAPTIYMPHATYHLTCYKKEKKNKDCKPISSHLISSSESRPSSCASSSYAQ